MLGSGSKFNWHIYFDMIDFEARVGYADRNPTALTTVNSNAFKLDVFVCQPIEYRNKLFFNARKIPLAEVMLSCPFRWST
ncbi:hypothetical protein [Desulfosporosinus sp.]|uniref:hypothetical protein n=1 Tax=Desulfosporosinus sp. TaxID=157907 RepID=UPI0026289D8F|nr:hypothetical protein [Desulfosporosinus sp.]